MVKKGIAYDLTKEVLPEHTARAMGSGSLDVLATPMLAAYMEEAAVRCVGNEFEGLLSTVGTRIDLRHIAASPVGMTIHISAELIEVDGRKMKFDISAYDDKELIGHAIHERCTIEVDSFMARAEGKLK